MVTSANGMVLDAVSSEGLEIMGAHRRVVSFPLNILTRFLQSLNDIMQYCNLVVSTVAPQQEASYPSLGLPVWSLHVVFVLAWVFSQYSDFLLQSKTMYVRSMSKVTLNCP